VKAAQKFGDHFRLLRCVQECQKTCMVLAEQAHDLTGDGPVDYAS
jgi:hypothetical protein